MRGGQVWEDQRIGSLGRHAVCPFARPPLGWVRRCERAIVSPTWMLRRDMQRRRALEEVPGTASMVSAFQYESVQRPLVQEEMCIRGRLAVDAVAVRVGRGHPTALPPQNNGGGLVA